jgi:hypothetical protein
MNMKDQEPSKIMWVVIWVAWSLLMITFGAAWHVRDYHWYPDQQMGWEIKSQAQIQNGILTVFVSPDTGDDPIHWWPVFSAKVK